MLVCWSIVALNQSVFVALPEQLSSTPCETQEAGSPATGDRPDLEQMARSLQAVGAATYCWNIETDEIVWHGDPGHVFANINPASYADGRAYASLLDPDNFTSRFETVMRNHHNDDGTGVAFSIEYSIKPFGRQQDHSIWVEDSGRWYAGPDGRPREVFGVVRQIDERHQQDQHLQFLGNCDPLTGMMNRGRLAEALGETIELARTEGHSSGFLIVSISNLAIVNDAYGFNVADDVIAKIGRRLREVVRTGDVIGRYSGSKFGIIMSRATKEDISIAAERFLTITRERVIETEMGPVWGLLSIGAVVLPRKGEDASITMAHAEEALTEATRMPTDAVVIYQPSEDIASERNLNSRCAVEIVHSLKENNFTLAYQPVVDAKTKEVVFHEALLRMKSDDGELIAAGNLIPISEKLGLIRLIDQLVAKKIMTTLRQFPEAKIAMNISGVTANDPRWFGKLTEILEDNKDVTDRLTVEMTETVMLEDIDQIVEFISKLHTLGCKVAIDDFGAGFTSFKNLQVLNVDEVKIDGSFCENLSENKDNQFFVRTLIDLSKRFNLKIVAEWVENETDARLLSSWGVDFLQGRLYGMAESQSPWGEPPVEEEEICVVPSEILLREGDGPQFVAEADKETDDIQPVAARVQDQEPDTRPFEAIMPESGSQDAIQDAIQDEPQIQIPELEIEVDEAILPTTRLDQQSPVAAEVGLALMDDTVAEEESLDDQLAKLRQALDKLNQVSQAK